MGSLWRTSLSLLTLKPGFRSDACEQLKAAYAARIAGQDETLRQVANTICRHMRAQHRQRPLVVLLTGPPGVGKSWTARVTAQALLSNEPQLPSKCEPEEAPCRALLQISAYSFAATDKATRLQQLQERIRAHVERWPEAVLVLEDFDRMDCELRDMLRDVSSFSCHPFSLCLQQQLLSRRGTLAIADSVHQVAAVSDWIRR